MKVKELIKELKKMPKDSIVYVNDRTSFHAWWRDLRSVRLQNDDEVKGRKVVIIRMVSE